MTMEYEIISLNHHLITQALYWHGELWLEYQQLVLLFPDCKSRLKRLLHHWVTYRNEAQPHTHCFSVMKMRKSAKSQAMREWLYQIRYYDTWYIRELLKECESEEAVRFLSDTDEIIHR